MPFISHNAAYTTGDFSSPLRLDRYVSEVLCLLSRSQIKARNLSAKVNGKAVKLSRPVKNGDILELVWDDSPPADVVPQDIPLDIIYEDGRCVVINKEQGMVAHPGAGNRQNTLANAIYFRMLQKKPLCRAAETSPDISSDISVDVSADISVDNFVSLRPGIVHRLDKDTSGVIIAAYDDEAHAFLASQFKSRSVRKTYIAIVMGAPKEVKGRMETCIARDPKDRRRFMVSANGKYSLTHYKVIKSWRAYSLVLLRPKTGRTHQLRVHLKHIGCPILGDPVYGSADKLFPDASLMLHSKSLAVTLPGEANARIFSTPVPARFLAIIEKLNRINANG